MSSFLSDLKFGLRLLVKSPAASLIAMLALGLGIGANTAIFSIANGLLLHPLPYAHMDRLLFVGERAPHQQNPSPNSVSPYNYLTWSAQAHAFQGLAAFHYIQKNLSGAGTPAMVQAAEVSPNFFDVLPSRLIAGRVFLPDEAQPGREREVILGQALWQHQFGANPAVVGQTVELDQTAYTIVGVMSDEAVMPQGVALWVPLALTPQQKDDRASHYIRLVGLLRPGATPQQAQAELSGIARRTDAIYPQTNKDWGVLIQTLADRVIGNQTASYIYLLFGAVGFLLLIACANVANLQFARALGRNHELALRTALGASRGRMLRQLLTESVLLGLGGALVGIAFAWFSIRLILAFMPADVAVFIGGWDHVRLDGPALAFTLAVAVAAGILAGLAPAWHAARPELNATLKEGGRGAIGHSRRRLRAALVVLQVALALSLLVGAGLMVQGFDNELNVARPIQPATLLTAAVNLPHNPHYADDTVRAQFWQQSLARLAALPGVAAVGTASSLPYGQGLNQNYFSIEGQPVTDASQNRVAVGESIDSGFFQLMHIPLVSGRAFTASDGASAPLVGIVSQRLAQRYFPGRSPIGERIKMGLDSANSTVAPWITIVGVASDVTWEWGDTAPEYTVYRPYPQSPAYSADFLLRGAGAGAPPGDVTRLGSAARQTITTVDPNQPLFDVMSLAESIHQASIGISYVAVMLAVSGVLALILAAIGVYGVMAYLVGERIHEIGIRRALGASHGDVIALVMRRGAVMLAWGLVLGLPLAFALARLMQSLLIGISPGDPLTYCGICLILIAMAAIACYVPARAATKVDPLIALREP